MDLETEWVDGNVLGGPLHEIFTMDITNATGRCANCGRVGPMAETHVYDHAAGLVARCASCDTVLMRLVMAPGRTFLDMQGLSFLELPTMGR